MFSCGAHSPRSPSASLDRVGTELLGRAAKPANTSSLPSCAPDLVARGQPEAEVWVRVHVVAFHAHGNLDGVKDAQVVVRAGSFRRGGGIGQGGVVSSVAAERQRGGRGEADGLVVLVEANKALTRAVWCRVARRRRRGRATSVSVGSEHAKEEAWRAFGGASSPLLTVLVLAEVALDPQRPASSPRAPTLGARGKCEAKSLPSPNSLTPGQSQHRECKHGEHRAGGGVEDG